MKKLLFQQHLAHGKQKQLKQKVGIKQNQDQTKPGYKMLK